MGHRNSTWLELEIICFQKNTTKEGNRPHEKTSPIPRPLGDDKENPGPAASPGKNAKKRNELLKYLENYINLSGMRGIKLFKVDGRNFGKKLIKKERL